MSFDPLFVVLLALALALAMSVPPTFMLFRDKRLFQAERGLEQRLHELEAEVSTLRGALRLYQDQVQILSADLAAARQTIAELKRVTAIYEQLSTDGTPIDASAAAASKRKPVRTAPSSPEDHATVLSQLASYKQQMAIVDAQIAAQGGDTQAPADLVAHRDRLQGNITRLERQLDERA